MKIKAIKIVKDCSGQQSNKCLEYHFPFDLILNTKVLDKYTTLWNKETNIDIYIRDNPVKYKTYGYLYKNCIIGNVDLKILNQDFLKRNTIYYRKRSASGN